MRALIDMLLDTVEGMERAYNAILRKHQPEPSFIIDNINWCTRSKWMDRLIAYKQLELWTFNK
jgi:hypothetical protein